jgi:hypothetical protein
MRRTMVVIALALGLAACDEAAGPGGGTALLAIRPQFGAAGVAGVVDIARTRIHLNRSGGATALDTVVTVPDGADSVTLVAQVSLQAPNESFVLTVAFITPQGDTAFYGGPLTIQPGGSAGSPVPIDLPTVYVGVGANALGVRITTPGAVLLANDTVTLVAEAFDSSGTAIPNTPIAWSSLDPGLAAVPDPAVGMVVSATSTGQARIVAALLTGPSDTLVAVVGVGNATVLFHASGNTTFVDPDSANSGRWFEVIDPVNGTVFPPLAVSRGIGEIIGLAYDPGTNMVYATDEDCVLLRINPATGAETSVGSTSSQPGCSGAPDYLKGLAYDLTGGRLLGGVTPEFSDGILYAINPATAVATPLGQVMTATGTPLDGFNGFAYHPNGTLYIVGHLSADGLRDRRLMTLNVATLIATPIALLPQTGVAGIAFTSNGTLYAVTGDGGANPESLWTVDPATAAMTLVIALGHGGGGEAIVAIPLQGGTH